MNWHAALAWALTGQALSLPKIDAPRVAELVEHLAAAGWSADRVGEHARSEIAAGRPWPHPVPPEQRAGLGAAQFAAALIATREALGLTALDVRAPSRRNTLTADERRLLADVPPHY